jgi:regulator of RNase E activity RraA
VRRGDIVFGDDDGLLIAPAERIEAALDTAEGIARAERAILAAQAEGTALHDLTNHDAHVAALDGGEDSKLAFTVDA